jgi:hypothetical protein
MTQLQYGGEGRPKAITKEQLFQLHTLLYNLKIHIQVHPGDDAPDLEQITDIELYIEKIIKKYEDSIRH